MKTILQTFLAAKRTLECVQPAAAVGSQPAGVCVPSASPAPSIDDFEVTRRTRQQADLIQRQQAAALHGLRHFYALSS